MKKQTRKNKYDKQYKNYSLKELQGILPYIQARLSEFIEVENEFQVIMYKQIVDAIEFAMSKF